MSGHTVYLIGCILAAADCGGRVAMWGNEMRQQEGMTLRRATVVVSSLILFVAAFSWVWIVWSIGARCLEAYAALRRRRRVELMDRPSDPVIVREERTGGG